MYRRALSLPDKSINSFFLWGPCKTGKTTLLNSCYPDALRIDLLKPDELMRYIKEPFLLREDVAALPPECEPCLDYADSQLPAANKWLYVDPASGDTAGGNSYSRPRREKDGGFGNSKCI